MNRSTINAYKDNYNKANFYWSYLTPGNHVSLRIKIILKIKKKYLPNLPKKC